MSYTVHNRLAECLAAKRIRKSQLAHRFGLSRAHVTRLVRGDVQPSLGLALRLAGYFGRPLDSIFELVATGQQAISPASLGSAGKLTNNKTDTKKR